MDYIFNFNKESILCITLYDYCYCLKMNNCSMLKLYTWYDIINYSIAYAQKVIQT